MASGTRSDISAGATIGAPPREREAASSLQSLDRAVSLLQAVASSTSGLPLTALAQQSELSKSTAHRILSRLVEHHLLRFSIQTKIYSLGIHLYRLGQSAASHFSVIELARPAMQRLADATEDTVFLSVIEGEEAICVERVVGAYPIKTLTLAPGDHRLLGVGAGALALLAALPEHEIRAVIQNEAQRQPLYPNVNAHWLERAVSEAHRVGYTFNPGRIITGMSAIGVAVLGANRRPLCALSVAAITARMNPKRRAHIAKLLQQEGTALEQQINAGPIT